MTTFQNPLLKTAGATDFYNVGEGKTAQEAFDKLRQRAHQEHGHGGYSGSIGEKGSFVMLTPPKGVKPNIYADWVVRGSAAKQVQLKNGQKCPSCKKGVLTIGLQTHTYSGGNSWQPRGGSFETMDVSCSNGCTSIWSTATGNGATKKFYTYREVKIPPKYQAQVQYDGERVNEKYGPAGAIQLTARKWLFFGMAPE